MYSYALVNCSKEKCGCACFLLREGKCNVREEMRFKKVFFLFYNIKFYIYQVHMAAGAGICVSGSGPGLIELLDPYENLHMRSWDWNSAALAGSRAVDIIWDYVNRFTTIISKYKNLKTTIPSKIRPARSACGASNNIYYYNICYLISKKKSTLSSAFHSECYYSAREKKDFFLSTSLTTLPSATS